LKLQVGGFQKPQRPSKTAPARSPTFRYLSIRYGGQHVDCKLILYLYPPPGHLEVVVSEVYLPLLSSYDPQMHLSGLSGDKLMDLLHRLVGSIQVTRGIRQVWERTELLYSLGELLT
jgi:hypothetical protein